MIDKTTKQVIPAKRDMNINPTGKGGFKDHPELINPGGRPKNIQRYDYWLQFFKNLPTKEFKQYIKDRPEDDMYMAEHQSYQRVYEGRRELKTWQVIADRTEGKAAQSVDITSGGDSLNQLKELTDEELDARIKEYLDDRSS